MATAHLTKIGPRGETPAEVAKRIVAERDNETVMMDRSSSLIALAKARVWASEGWEVTIIVGEENDVAPVDVQKLLVA